MDGPHLLHNLPRGEGAEQAEPAGGAVRAALRAAGLRRHTNRPPALRLQRDAHSLDGLPGVQLEEELHEGVVARGVARQQRQRRHADGRRHRGQRRGAAAVEAQGQRLAPAVDGGQDFASFTDGARGHSVGQLLRRQALQRQQQRRHGTGTAAADGATQMHVL